MSAVDGTRAGRMIEHPKAVRDLSAFHPTMLQKSVSNDNQLALVTQSSNARVLAAVVANDHPAGEIERTKLHAVQLETRKVKTATSELFDELAGFGFEQIGRAHV